MSCKFFKITSVKLRPPYRSKNPPGTHKNSLIPLFYFVKPQGAHVWYAVLGHHRRLGNKPLVLVQKLISGVESAGGKLAAISSSGL